jgi:hypothetical protein
MNETIEQTVKTKKPKKNKVAVNGERQIVDSPLSKLWGLLEGKISYESDDIFYAYRFNN